MEFCLFRSSGFVSKAFTVAMLNSGDFSNLRALHFTRLQYAASEGRRPTLAAVYVTVSENNAAPALLGCYIALLTTHRLATASLIHWYLCNILSISDLLFLPPPLPLTNE